MQREALESSSMLPAIVEADTNPAMAVDDLLTSICELRDQQRYCEELLNRVLTMSDDDLQARAFELKSLRNLQRSIMENVKFFQTMSEDDMDDNLKYWFKNYLRSSKEQLKTLENRLDEPACGLTSDHLPTAQMEVQLETSKDVPCSNKGGVGAIGFVYYCAHGMLQDWIQCDPLEEDLNVSEATSDDVPDYITSITDKLLDHYRSIVGFFEGQFSFSSSSAPDLASLKAQVLAKTPPREDHSQLSQDWLICNFEDLPCDLISDHLSTTHVEARLQTFTDFPRSCPISKEDLAAAGFVYDGIGDSVMCFHCRNTLQNWIKCDPLEQHLKVSRGKCEFAKREAGKRSLPDFPWTQQSPLMEQNEQLYTHMSVDPIDMELGDLPEAVPMSARSPTHVLLSVSGTGNQLEIGPSTFESYTTAELRVTDENNKVDIASDAFGSFSCIQLEVSGEENTLGIGAHAFEGTNSVQIKLSGTGNKLSFGLPASSSRVLLQDQGIDDLTQIGMSSSGEGGLDHFPIQVEDGLMLPYAYTGPQHSV